MIRINEIALSLDEDESQLKKKAAKILKINEKYIKKYTIYKKSIDARKKDDVHFTYSLDVNISLDEEQIASKCKSNKVQIVKPYVYERKQKSKQIPSCCCRFRSGRYVCRSYTCTFGLKAYYS